jgi:uncharacterized repeat protein (TIGR01451 family)
MKKLTNLHHLLGAACCVGLALTACEARAQAQQPDRDANSQRTEAQRQANARPEGHPQAHAAHPGGFTMTLPPASGAIEITAEAPAEARVNSDIEYRIRLRNVTDNLMLHDIVLAEGKSGTSKIESVTLADEKPAGPASENQQSQKDQKEAAAPQDEQNPQPQNDDQQNQEGQNQSQKKQKRQKQKKQNPKQAQSESAGLTSSGDGTWTIGVLGPGQSKTLVVKASAEQEGPAMTCLTVKSFQPAICLMTEVVKPEIQITKNAPKQAPLCEPFEIEYVITNPGTGDIDAFTLRDPLPEGLRLIDEEQKIAYKVDGLKAGDTRSFIARVVADRPGDYRSRAEAVAGEDLQARSAEVGTKVVAADLAVQIEGPTQTYVNRNLTYTAFVRNAGDAPARDARLTLRLPQQNMRLVDIGSVRTSDRQFQTRAKNQPTNAPEAEPLGAEKAANAAEQKKAAGNDEQNSPQLADARTIELGDLAPGETRQVGFVVRATEADTFPVQAAATSVCGENKENRAQAVAQTQVEVLSLAALAIGVADEQDPVPVGKQVTYLVSVVNEGTAADQNVKVTAKLPPSLEFVQADGQSEVTNEGGNLTFAPVETLEPGAKAEWRVVVKAKEPGNVRFEMDVTSDKSADNVTAEEPTTLFKEQ